VINALKYKLVSNETILVSLETNCKSDFIGNANDESGCGYIPYSMDISMGGHD